jgi:hypothetical protein
MTTTHTIPTGATVTFTRLNRRGRIEHVTVLARNVYPCADGAVILYGPRIWNNGRTTYDKAHVLLPTHTVQRIEVD